MARAKKQVVSRPTKVGLWAALVEKAEASGTWDIKSAYMAAEENAYDTFREQGHAHPYEYSVANPEEFAALAYGSLSLTGNFTDKAAVREFYDAAGYRW